MISSILQLLSSTRNLIILVFLLGRTATLFAQEPDLDHEVYLIGDAGEPDRCPENFELMASVLQKASANSTVIILGDNIYSKGLPAKGHTERAIHEKKLSRQLDLIKAFKGKAYILPGNHDWAKGKQSGWQNVLNQERFVEEYLQDENVFFPKGGCPGPLEFELADDLFLILFDMQWMLHPWEKPGNESACEFQSTIDVLVEIDNLIKKHKNDRVIVAAHHPMYSDGIHGGKTELKDHIFPLTAANKSLYIPLPVIGSIYPIFRSAIGNIQDIAHPKYKAIRNAIVSSLKENPNAVYVSGHEHSLQHIQREGINYIVSGSASKTSHVKPRSHSKHAAERNGFAKINYYQSGAVATEFWSPNGTASGEKIYEGALFQFEKIIVEKPDNSGIDFSNKKVVVKASQQYGAGGFKRFLMGSNYRDIWDLDIEVDVFDIATEKGGLSPIKKGGGMQTKSLRMKASDGKQYVLRSIEKYPENALPPLLRKTIALSIIQDQISASNPYGAVVVPFLAEAANVYHTNPKIVYIPDDPRLEEFQEVFANTLALFEERPAKDWSDAPFFGNSDDLINTFDVLKKLKKDNDNYVDQEFVLKSRLFDLIIADWDRHDDQWRWASFKDKKGKVFRPIPRDRDQAFFLNEGLVPKIVSRRWALPKIEGFNNEVRWTPGLAFNARYFDRTFLTNLSKADWVRIAAELKGNITDEVIENAIKQWPEAVYDITGERVIATLKSRRDRIDTYAIELYNFLAKTVEVLGTNKTEHIAINRLTNGDTKVTVNKVSKKGEMRQATYERVFTKDETKEVRIYGHGGDDTFDITGTSKNATAIRIIGGEGDDTITDASSPGSSRNVRVYDNKGTTIESEHTKIKRKLSDETTVHNHNRLGFKYDVLFPVAYWQYNKDDGIFLGGGFIFTKNGWRKFPYASKHRLSGDMAFATKAFNIKYLGEFTRVIGSWNLEVLADVSNPFSVNNFFGLGNESINDHQNRGIDYYRLRYESSLYRLNVSKSLGAHGKLTLGPQYQSFEVHRQSDKFLSDGPVPGVDINSLFGDTQNYGGLYVGLDVDTRDSKQLTTRGIYWKNEIEALEGLSGKASSFTRVRSEISFFYSVKYPARLTIATRVGVAHNFGGFEFYNANVLGGRSNLRGFRRTRFYGETSFYHNIDMRLKLFSFRSYLFPGQVGIHVFHDVGRVWLEGENSDIWHRGAGGGIWIAPLGQAVISFTLAYTDEENLPSIGLGFFF